MVYPIKSIPDLPGAWTKEKTFEEAARNADAQSTTSEIYKSPSTRCCCKRKSKLLLPGRVMNDEGEPVKVVQHILGFVQPLAAITCEDYSCLNEVGEIITCSQKWGTEEMFTYDSHLDGYVQPRGIRVPNGCVCEAENVIESQQSNRSLSDVLSDRKDVFLEFEFSTENPLTSEDNVSLDWSKLTEKIYDSDYPDNFLKVSNESLDIRESLSEKELQYAGKYEDLEDLFNLYESSVSKLEGTTYTRDQLNIPIQRPSSETSADQVVQPVRYSEYPQSVSIKPVTKDVDGDENFSSNDHPALVSSGQLDELSNLFSASRIVQLNNYLASLSGSPISSDLNNQLKMGLLFGGLGQMTTRDILEYISKKFEGDQWIRAQEIVQKIMETETEYLRLSLKMMEMMLDHTEVLPVNENSPKYPLDFAQFENSPNLLRPGVDYPDRINQASAPISYLPSYPNNQQVPSFFQSSDAQNLNSLQELSLSEGTGSSVLGLNKELQLPSNLDLSSKPSNVHIPSREVVNGESSTVRGESNPPSREGRMIMIDTFEEDLHSAMGNFLFQEAWMTEMCSIPTQINESVSELRFLPAFIRENFNIEAKGMLDIDKFAGRIVSAIIGCHFQDPESALLDGRLATAISGGIVAAEMLNSQIRIMKMMMQGLLDSGDAENIVSLLQWSVQPHGNVTAAEFLSNGEKNYLNYVKNTVQDSLQEYVEFLKAKSSEKFNGNSLESQVTNSSAILNKIEPQSPALAQTNEDFYNKPSVVSQGSSNSDTKPDLSYSLPAEESSESSQVFNNDAFESVGTPANITTESTTAIAVSFSEASVIETNSYSNHTDNYLSSYSGTYEGSYNGTTEVSSTGSYASSIKPPSLHNLIGVSENTGISSVGPNSGSGDYEDYNPYHYEYNDYEYENEKEEKKDEWSDDFGYVDYGYNSGYGAPHDKGSNSMKNNSTLSNNYDPEYYKNKGVKNEYKETGEYYDYGTPADKHESETKYDEFGVSDTKGIEVTEYGDQYSNLDGKEETSDYSGHDKDNGGNTISEYDPSKEKHDQSKDNDHDRSKDDHEESKDDHDESKGDDHDESKGDDHDESKGDDQDESKGDDQDESKGDDQDESKGDDQDESKGDDQDESKDEHDKTKDEHDKSKDEHDKSDLDEHDKSDLDDHYKSKDDDSDLRGESFGHLDDDTDKSKVEENGSNSREDNLIEVSINEDTYEASRKNDSQSESLENTLFDNITTPEVNSGLNNAESLNQPGNDLDSGGSITPTVDEDISRENAPLGEYSPLDNVNFKIIFPNLHN